MAFVEDKVHRVLSHIASEQNYEDPEILITKLLRGESSYTFTAIIREENKQDLHLFGKVSTMGESCPPCREELPMDLFKIEQFLYQNLAKIYASLEEENGVPEEHRLYFPKCYGCDPTRYHEIIVLENLLEQGYHPHDRFQSIDWEYASSAVTNLAKMHALSFAFSKQRPEEYEKSLATLYNQWGESESMAIIFKKEASKAVKNVKPEYREALQKYLGELKRNPFIAINRTVRSTVISHGEFNGKKVMHRVREDGKVDTKIVDLQTLQRDSPVVDLIFFILTGSDEEFRAKYFQKLLDHYYTQLSASMKRLNLNPEETFSRKDFDFEMKEKLPFGLTLAVYGLPMLTVESENAPEANESLELYIKKTSDLYVERLNGVVNDYVKWGFLK